VAAFFFWRPSHFRRPGGNIMIHGQPNGFGWSGGLLQLVDWTDGCIAVTDSDMDEIWTIVSDGTPIEIEPQSMSEDAVHE
jgi:murein L,D-transpeptidase YafK